MPETNQEIIDRMVEEEIGNNPRLKSRIAEIKTAVHQRLSGIDLVPLNEDEREDKIANALTPFTAKKG